MAEKKKKKGGNGKKKKKAGENVYEALLEYKITVIDKELEEWRFRVHKLEEENEDLLGRDAHLKEECSTTMKRLVRDALKFDKENISYPKIGKEDVHAALHEKMNAAAEEEAELRRIHSEMLHVEIEIFKTRSKIKQLVKYRDVTRLEEHRAIQLLERELAYMIDNYVVLSKHLEKTAQSERTALTEMAKEKVEQKTRAATERVAMGLDRFTRKMYSENQYMNQEIGFREQELIELENRVRQLELTNLEISEKLNNANLTDAASLTNIFVTESANDDLVPNFATNALLAVDLSDLTIRGEHNERTFEEILNELDHNTPRLSTGKDADSILSSMNRLHIEGTNMRIQPPPVLNEEEEECLDFKGPTWIAADRIKSALRKT